MNYNKADKAIVDLVYATLTEHHPHLDGVRIAVVCQDTASKKDGKVQLASTSKPTGKLTALIPDSYDFVICIAEDEWHGLSVRQRQAVIDHELCHCALDPFSGEGVLVGHDFEEFGAVIKRHGLWREDTGERRVQGALFEQGYTVDAPELRTA